MSFEIPGFSTEQVASLIKLMEEMLDRAFEKHFGPLPPQPNQAVIMPKPAQPSKQKQEQQAIAEDSLESTTKKRRRRKKKSPVNTSLLPTIPRLRAMSTCRESAPYLSTARIQHASNLAPLFVSQHAQLLASRLASPLGYIRDAEDMEATGQG